MTNLINQLTSTLSLSEGTSTAIASNLDLADGIGTLNGTTVKVNTTSGSAQGRLSIANQPSNQTSGTVGNSIQWNYDDNQKTLTLSGEASEADYEAALRQVVYINTSGTGSKSVEISISKAGLDPVSGGYYEYVAVPGLTWKAANDNALGSTFLGAKGHLVTITSEAEQNFVQGLVLGNAWIGGSDEVVEGTWRWITGPETGTPFWQGNQNGASSGDNFANWFQGEPNNSGDVPGEDYAMIAGPKKPGQDIDQGKWYDEPNISTSPIYGPNGYLVEYGKFVGSQVLALTINPTDPLPQPPTDPHCEVVLPILQNPIFHFGRFAAFQGFTNQTIPYAPFTSSNLSVNQVFDETFYLEKYRDVASAVQGGQFGNGLQHFQLHGQSEGRRFTSAFTVGGLETALFFDEVRYLRINQDVCKAVAAGQFSSGLDHFKQFGWLEGRDFTSVFNESFYLGTNLDVAQAVVGGVFKSGFQHFALHGHQELRNPSQLFNQQDYLTRYSDVQTAINMGTLRSAFEHWTNFGADEMRTPQLMLFQEDFYLAQYADVRNAVQGGLFSSGYNHYVAFGSREGRNPSPIFDEGAYLELNPDVKASVQAGGLLNGLSHYVLFGRAEGREIAAVAA